MRNYSGVLETLLTPFFDYYPHSFHKHLCDRCVSETGDAKIIEIPCQCSVGSQNYPLMNWISGAWCSLNDVTMTVELHWRPLVRAGFSSVSGSLVAVQLVDEVCEHPPVKEDAKGWLPNNILFI